MTARTNELGHDTYDVMVDIDDVFMPWFVTVNDALIAAWGEPETPCEIWAMYEHYGRTREEWSEVVTQVVEAGLYTRTEPFPYAAEAIRRLYWYGHRIHIVTARGFMERGPEIRQWTREYLDTYAIPHQTLTFAKDKLEAMEALETVFDYAIDDGIHNYERLREGGVNVYLQNAPHNAAYEVEPERRVDSLWTFANLIVGKS